MLHDILCHVQNLPVGPGSDSMPALMACLASSVMLLFATFFAFRKSVAVSGDPQTDKNKSTVLAQ
jgi:hypothetical protein